MNPLGRVCPSCSCVGFTLGHWLAMGLSGARACRECGAGARRPLWLWPAELLATVAGFAAFDRLFGPFYLADSLARWAGLIVGGLLVAAALLLLVGCAFYLWVLLKPSTRGG